MKTWNQALLTGMMAVVGFAAGGVTNASGKNARIQSDSASKDAVAAKGKAPQSAHPPLNACGCYAVDGACVCTSRALKCDCPGDCEPLGCESKRQKEIDRQLADETKRIRDEDRRRAEAERAKQATVAPKDDDDDTGDSAAGDAATDGKAKAAAKPAAKTPNRAAKSKPSQAHAPG